MTDTHYNLLPLEGVKIDQGPGYNVEKVWVSIGEAHYNGIVQRGEVAL